MSSKIKFKPWIGDRYQQGINGKKVLILGESHYCASLADAVPEITQSVISDLLDSNSPHEAYKNTYSKFAKAMTGIYQRMNVEQKSALWHSVAFYNYVQEALTGPRIAPSSAQFKASEPAFWELLDALQPELIIAWGHRLYDNLPGSGNVGDDVIGPDGTHFETWIYTLVSDRKIRVLGIDHPSIGFSPDYWHQVIKQLM